MGLYGNLATAFELECMRTMVFDFVKSVVYSVTVDPKRMRSGDEIVPSQPTVGIFVPGFIKM